MQQSRQEAITIASDFRDWINLRNERGQVAARYNRRTRELIIFRRNGADKFSLAALDTPCEKSADVLG